MASFRHGGKSAAAFRTISEVAEDIEVPQHVLRFWESKFTQLKPMKRGGGRRYYRPEDIDSLRQIKHLLYEEGYTIKGVQKLLRTGLLKTNSTDDGGEQIVTPFIKPDRGASKTSQSDIKDERESYKPALKSNDRGEAAPSKRTKDIHDIIQDLESLQKMLKKLGPVDN